MMIPLVQRSHAVLGNTLAALRSVFAATAVLVLLTGGQSAAELPQALAALTTETEPPQMSRPRAETDTRTSQMAFGQVCRINPGLACFLQFPLPINSGCQCFFPEFNPPIYYGIVTFQ